MKFLYPRFPLRDLPVMIRIAALGAIIAGLYGAVHDQISYSISAEYFTKVKFRQFVHVDLGLPPRIFAAEIGFLATWWVGLIGGWLLARFGLAEMTRRPGGSPIVRAFAIVTGVGAAVGLIGALLGAFCDDLSSWTRWQEALDLQDVRGFVIVAYLHWASYLGGLLGVICAVWYVKKKKAWDPEGEPPI